MINQPDEYNGMTIALGNFDHYTDANGACSQSVPNDADCKVNNVYRKEESKILYKDLTGMQFGQLVVYEKSSLRDYKGSVVWKCKCSCGSECTYSEDMLIHHKTISCGCYRSEVLRYNLNKGLHRMEGTCLERLCLTKARSDSRSGYIGIYITKDGRYRASIGFKGKRYWLGTFSNLEDALAARKRGEQMHEKFVAQIKQIMKSDKVD